MATWFVWSGATGAADGTSFTDAYTSLDALFIARAIAGADVIKMADDHDNGSYASSKNWPFPESGFNGVPVYLVSTNRTSGNPSAGAIEQTGGNFNLQFRQRLHAFGVTFKVGSGSSQGSAFFLIGDSSVNQGPMLFENCNFVANTTTSAGATIVCTSNSASLSIIFRGCDFSFGATAQTLELNGNYVEFIDCTLSGTVPTTLFSCSNQSGNSIQITGCDFSTPTNLLTASRRTVLVGKTSKLPANIVPSEPAGSSGNCHYIELHSCGTGDHNYYYASRYLQGSAVQDIANYLTSGYTSTDNDGTSVNSSIKMTSHSAAADCNKHIPLYSAWFNQGVFSTGSKTISLKVAHTEAAVLKDNEVFMEVEAMTSSGNTPLTQRFVTAPVVSGTRIFDTGAAGTNLTDTAEPWTGLSSPKTHTLSKTITINEQGWIRARIGFTVNNKSVWVNPEVLVA